MMRLIDADALKETIGECPENWTDSPVEVAEFNMWHRVMDDIDSAPTIGGWISVNDRLPDKRHAVLAFSPHHNNIWALSLHEDGFWYYWMDTSRRYDPLWMGPITRWRPLPEPPRESE